jgi:hypothetical protein
LRKKLLEIRVCERFGVATADESECAEVRDDRRAE